jgi:hypothetical protein
MTLAAGALPALHSDAPSSTFRATVWGIRLVLISFVCAGLWCIDSYVHFGFIVPPPPGFGRLF